MIQGQGTSGVDTVEQAEQRFGALLGSIPEVEQFFAYRPEAIDSTTVVMAFDFAGQTDAATTKITANTYEFEVEIYVMGYDRADMQKRLALILLKIQDALRGDPKLGRTFGKSVALRNTGPARPATIESNPVLLKRLRLIGEREERA